MEIVLVVLGGVLGLALGISGGLWLGGLIRERGSWLYWVLNFLVLALGVLGNFAGLRIGQFAVVVFSLSLIGGGLTGLKYGYGRSVGLWRVHDRAMGSDDLPRR
jgi:hypothetical protein